MISVEQSPLINYSSVQSIKEVLEKYKLSINKQYGQNFLLSKYHREKIASVALDTSNSYLWEIGAGLGSLTTLLLKKASRLVIFEIDKGYISLLSSLFSKEIKAKKLVIIKGDVLKTYKTTLTTYGLPSVILGNLPYNIAAVFIASLIENKVTPPTLLFTMQKEVALRALNTGGDKDYSSFSVLCNSLYSIKKLFDLPPALFYPPPHITSSTLLFSKKEPLIPENEWKVFIKLNRALFLHRRKTIKNNLTTFLGDANIASDILIKTNIKENARIEEVSIPNIVTLTHAITMLEDKDKKDKE